MRRPGFTSRPQITLWLPAWRTKERMSRYPDHLTPIIPTTGHLEDWSFWRLWCLFFFTPRTQHFFLLWNKASRLSQFFGHSEANERENTPVSGVWVRWEGLKASRGLAFSASLKAAKRGLVCLLILFCVLFPLPHHSSSCSLWREDSGQLSSVQKQNSTK